MKEKWKIISPGGESWKGSTALRCIGKVIRKKDISDVERINNLVESLTEPIPYQKRGGMKISASGVLERSARICQGLPDDIYPRYEVPLREMLKHLQEMADRFYSRDDFFAVDEFLQLYALDKERVDPDVNA